MRSFVTAATPGSFRDNKGHLNQVKPYANEPDFRELNKPVLCFLKLFTDKLGVFLLPMNMVILHEVTYLHDKDMLFP